RSSAPRAAPAPPGARFPGGAFRRSPGSSRFVLSANQYPPATCEETPRRQFRRHGPCDSGGSGEWQEEGERTPRTSWSPLNFRLEKESATMSALTVYAIPPTLWRWEIRCGGALLLCGTAPTRAAAEMAVSDVINT